MSFGGDHDLTFYRRVRHTCGRLLVLLCVAGPAALLATALAAEPLAIKIADAKVVRNSRGDVVVAMTVDRDSAKAFTAFSGQYLGRPMEIWVDGKLVSASVIREPLTGGEVQISGGFTDEQAQAFAALLNQPNAKVELVGK
jgi:preprotein translocase subunit SecD